MHTLSGCRDGSVSEGVFFIIYFGLREVAMKNSMNLSHHLKQEHLAKCDDCELLQKKRLKRNSYRQLQYSLFTFLFCIVICY